MIHTAINGHIAMPAGARMKAIAKRDGFSGQVQYVIPRPLLADAARHILVSGLYPTDIGWYPKARRHARERPEGAEQNILIVCTAGSGWYRLRGRRRVLRAHQALIIPRGESHAYGASRSKPWTIHWVHFLGEEASYFAALLRQGRFTLPLPPALTVRVEGLFRDACEALSGGFTQQNIIVAAQAVRHLLGLLFFSNPAFLPQIQGARHPGLDVVIQFMKERVEQSLRIADFAQCAGLSASHFSRQFQRQTGVAPMDYFIHLKIQRACRFLTLTQLSIKEIAARLGYDDPYYFSRCFKRIMGVPPAHYRNVKLG